ncbi:MAG: hypothetical protein KDK02_17985 [Rhodobacteraceae bacterium]|nr:hypothetical protein [Paracoccaceae bacterium]
MSRLSALWMVPPVAIGIAAAVWFVRNAPEPARVETALPGLAVRIERVEPRAIRPLARGWGNVRAAESWTALAEVRGQVLWRHPDLEAGELIPAGTRVMEIDPADYKLAIAQAEADLAALKAEAAQIEAEAENTARVLELEQARLAISESDLARIRELVAQGTAAQTRAEDAERAALLARRTVVELQNTLSLTGPRRDRVEAQTARTQAALARARRDLDHTSIVTPYDLRVTSVPTERFQYVNIGQTLLTGDGVTRAEAVAQVPLPAFQRLLRGSDPVRDTLAAIRAGPSSRIGAEIRLVSDPSQVWPATVSRVEGALDARARTVPVVVTVDSPYANANPPLRPPLLPNMQVEVTLTGNAIADSVAIPDNALHGGFAYVLDSDSRLDLRPVVEAFRQDGLVVIESGLSAGDLLVLDDIAPAIPGMALVPVGDGQ